MTPTTALAASWPHIDFAADGIPFISGTTMKVVELILAQRAHGWSPEELHFQFPFLGMNQIHSALAYFWDHRAEIEADIARRDRRVEELRRQLAPGDADPLAMKLRRLKAAG